MASARRIRITGNFPKKMSEAIRKDARKAMKAVKNHPPITVSTPVIRYTALSLPQAPSARDVAHGHHKGYIGGGERKFQDVPMAIRILATTRFTEALTRSKDKPFLLLPFVPFSIKP